MVATSNNRGRLLPPEAAASLIAVGAVAVTGLFGVPAFGMFLAWAAASLSAGRTRPTTLALCLLVGSSLATGTLAAQELLQALFSVSTPEWLSAAIALAITNPLLIALTRLPLFASAPGMFVGFSTMFAVHLGGFTPAPGTLMASLIVTAATTLAGVTFPWLFHRLTIRPSAPSHRRRAESQVAPSGHPRMRAWARKQ